MRSKASKASKHSKASKKSSKSKRKMDYEEDPHEESQYLNLENELAEEHEYPGNGGDSDEEIFGKSNRKKGSSRQKGSKRVREPEHNMGGNDEDSWEGD